VLMVPLGEAFALLPLSRHFPDALAPVLQIVAVRTAAETRSASTPSAPTRARQPKRAPARGSRTARDASPLTAGRSAESRKLEAEREKHMAGKFMDLPNLQN
jgi:hypothetical protein